MPDCKTCGGECWVWIPIEIRMTEVQRGYVNQYGETEYDTVVIKTVNGGLDACPECANKMESLFVEETKDEEAA